METFESVALEWFDNQAALWDVKNQARIRKDLYSADMQRVMPSSLVKIDLQFVLSIIRDIEKRGALTRARSILMLINRVLKYAHITGRIDSVPSLVLYGALKKRKKKHYASLKIDDIPAFLSAVDNGQMEPTTKGGIYLLMLTFLRTNELIGLKWADIDWNQKHIEIPAERMKMRRPHIVPLSDWAIDILKQLHNDGEYVFPARSNATKHISNMTMLMAIYRLGYKHKMTGHGFRSLAMTAIKEKLGYQHEVIDRQLAHASDRTYDRSEFITERIRMMSDWADYLSSICFS